MGLGNDGLGSLRHPAQCCGISVLKPTLGRIPDATTTAPADWPIGAQLVDVQGPLARRVADLRAALEVLAGPTWRDPWSVPAPLRGPEPAKPLRVALVVDPAGQGTATQVQDGVRKAARALEGAGYAVQEVEPPSIEVAAKILLDMLNTPDVRAMWQVGSQMMPGDTRRFLSEFYRVAGEPDPVMTMQSFATRQTLLRAWGQFQQQYPLIVAPICTEVPLKAGTDLDEGRVAETIRGMRMAIAVNALGLPAVALPVGVGDGSAGGAGDRPSLPGGPVPGCRGGAGGPGRDHHADRSQVTVRTMSTSMDRLTALDQLMLRASKVWPQDIGALALLDGTNLLDPTGRLRIEAVRGAIASRLHLVPRFRQVVHVPRRGLGGPLWVDAPSFDLNHHVRVLPLPADTGEAELLVRSSDCDGSGSTHRAPCGSCGSCQGCPTTRSPCS